MTVEISFAHAALVSLERFVSCLQLVCFEGQQSCDKCTWIVVRSY